MFGKLLARGLAASVIAASFSACEGPRGVLPTPQLVEQRVAHRATHGTSRIHLTLQRAVGRVPPWVQIDSFTFDPGYAFCAVNASLTVDLGGVHREWSERIFGMPDSIRPYDGCAEIYRMVIVTSCAEGSRAVVDLSGHRLALSITGGTIASRQVPPRGTCADSLAAAGR